MTDWDELESPIKCEPVFFVEKPDGRKDLTEIERAVMFRRYLRELAPSVVLYPNANAGKRNPTQARREGIVPGVFDYTAAWDVSASTLEHAPVSVAWVELKGYDKNGRPGRLSQAQIEFGNRMHARGHKVACFFSGKSAFDWLASLGAPIRGRFT